AAQDASLDATQLTAVRSARERNFHLDTRCSASIFGGDASLAKVVSGRPPGGGEDQMATKKKAAKKTTKKKAAKK
ncbi:MAG TPA: hypothetical protein VMR65_09550, partial [Candidatus Sulfotelmatobacter sp.]|nr:hypothetical protein [Candidatus Sulfotelmatobacter sp.]